MVITIVVDDTEALNADVARDFVHKVQTEGIVEFLNEAGDDMDNFKIISVESR